MPKENASLFEIFGPIMIGPSSSHTAGVARIAFLARRMFARRPDRATVKFYGSFASTWRGHGSGSAVIAGLLGIPPEDERLARGEELLEEAKIEGAGFPVDICPMSDLPASWHPNSLVIELEAEADSGPSGGSGAGGAVPGDGTAAKVKQRIRATSIGGGSIRIDEIDGYQVSLSGALNALLVLHHDEIGVIAIVSHILAASRINIAATSSHRKEKGDEALLVVETDHPIPNSVVEQIEGIPPIYRVIRVPSLE